MTRRRHALRLALLVGAVLHVAAAPGEAQEPSVISLPISIELESIRALAQDAVPRAAGANRFDFAINGGADRGGISAGYGVERGPLSFAWSGGRLVAAADLAYWIHGRTRLGVLVHFSCGTNGERPRRARMRVATRARVDASWTLRTATTLDALDPIDRCRMTALGLDVTSRIFERFRAEVTESLAGLDASIASRVDLRETVSRAWELMASPMPVGDGAWLVVDPQKIGVTPIVGDARSLSATVRILARPRIVLGAEPARAASPLPPPSELPGGDSFRIEVPVDVPYARLEETVRAFACAEIARLGLPSSGPMAVVVRGVEIRGEGARVRASIHLDGGVQGSIVVEATPQLDPATSRILFPDLAIRARLNGLPSSAIENDTVRDGLRAMLQVDMAPELARTRELIQAALDRQSGRVTMTAAIDPLEITGLSLDASTNGVRVLAAIRGSVRLTVR